MRAIFLKFVASVVLAAAPELCSAISVTLQPTIPSPAPLGTAATWVGETADAGDGTLWYRFRVRAVEGEFHTIRDFGPVNTLVWATIDHEGFYEVEVTVRNVSTGDSATAATVYELTPLATGSGPVITPTANPLVFIYSAPPCQVGLTMNVQFQSPSGNLVKTPSKPCLDGKTMNFYLAGLRTASEYQVRHAVEGNTEEQPEVPAETQVGPDMALPVPEFLVDRAPTEVLQPPADSQAGGVILLAPLNDLPTATDLSGNLLWFYPEYMNYLTRAEAGGYFYGVSDNHDADESGQIFRKFDVAGITVAETNAARVNEQLAAMGRHPITAFHHEAAGLPDGRIVVLAGVERILTDVQGPGDVNVLGDAIIVLNRELEVVWAWDAFDHLDPRRAAISGEKCLSPSPGCSPFYLSEEANDWTHGNSVQPTPDGNLLFSVRHQDWLVKIDYKNGEGTGDIIWRLGREGDFSYDSSDSYPWFSHQHDARYIDESTIIVFDNGNTRRGVEGFGNSRGQVIRLDEENRRASLVLNADLGGYSAALSSSGKLPNGNYYFGIGFLNGSSARSVEVDAAGNIVYSLESDAPTYRSFRMQDLYTPY